MPPKKKAKKDPSLEKYEEELRSLADEQLRRALMDIGENPGPIDSSNRDIYIRLLVRKKIKVDSTKSISGKDFPSSSSTQSTSGPLSTLFMTPSSESSPTVQRKRGKDSTQLTRSPLVTTKALPLSQTKKRLSASPTLTAQPKVSQAFEVKGLVAAVFTPFNIDGELNLSVIKTYVDLLLRQRVTHVFVCGTTGESLSLTVAERKLVAEEWIKQAGEKLTVIIHVGSESLKSTCELASHAEEIGAAAIGVMPTTFFKPSSLDALVLYLQKVGEAAPNSPMYYYHIPTMTGVRLSMEGLVERATIDLPTFRGLKYTDEDLMQLSRCLEFERGKYNFMYGRDEQVLGALSMGVTAAVGSTYNYCGMLNNRLLQAFAEGDLQTALKEQRRSQATITLLRKYGGHVGVGKAFMKLRGLDLGPPRLPLLPLSMDEFISLKKDLQSIGFSEWA